MPSSKEPMFGASAAAIAAALAILAAGTDGVAQTPENFAGRYAQTSQSLLAGGGLSFNSNNNGMVTATNTLGLVLEAQPRFVFSHIALQPDLEIAYSTSTNSGPNATVVALVGGAAVGYAFALSDRFAVTPMGGFDILYASVSLGTFGSTDVTYGRLFGEVPLTIFVGRNGFIEPYLDVGALLPISSNAGSGANFLFVLGYRVGVTF